MISSEFQPTLIFLISFFAAMFVLPKLAYIARKINLLDQPNWRQVHSKPIPLVGGIGFVLSACFALSFFISTKGLCGFFVGLGALLLVGFFDDLKELGYRQKFVGQIFAAILFISLSHLMLTSFGDILGIGEIVIPSYWLSFVVSIFCILGVINSMNLIDGLDGLSGGLGFVAFLVFAAHASFAGNHLFLLLNLAFAGALLGFLRYNWYPAVLFMGDAGSLSLGFILAFMSIAMSQGDNACIQPISALLILAVPISDTLTIMSKRIMQGKSPFHPDKFHLHHIFMRYGLNRKLTVKTIIGFGAILGSSSLLAPIYHLSDRTMFMVFGLYFSLYFMSSFFIVDLLRYSLKFRRKREWCGGPCIILQRIFKFMDLMNIIRKKTRFTVSLPIQCFSLDTKQIFIGEVLNISESGFMASIPEITSLGSKLFIDVNLNPADILSPESIQIMAEHLWISSIDGRQFHGFQFIALNQEQKDKLELFTEDLRKENIGSSIIAKWQTAPQHDLLTTNKVVEKSFGVGSKV